MAGFGLDGFSHPFGNVLKRPSDTEPMVKMSVPGCGPLRLRGMTRDRIRPPSGTPFRNGHNENVRDSRFCASLNFNGLIKEAKTAAVLLAEAGIRLSLSRSFAFASAKPTNLRKWRKRTNWFRQTHPRSESRHPPTRRGIHPEKGESGNAQCSRSECKNGHSTFRQRLGGERKPSIPKRARMEGTARQGR